MSVYLIGHQAGHLTRDGRVGGDIAVVHYGVSAEDEGVGVYLCDDASGGGADVGHDAGAGGGGADGLEVRGVQGRVGDFVEGGVEDGAGGGGGGGGGGGEEGFVGGVPGHSEAVDVEKVVALGDFGLGGCAGVDFGVVGEEEGEVVVVDLFGDCVSWCWGGVRSCNNSMGGRYHAY
ncbi:hypothetical protein V500_00512 [Pseudogymnoascus sp. VKM F-4518 (FW-2643)]|nr:hypothetical protein V500_00512 [Pseudogymnoascus sp. VKM F-4518 (FW-2643)]